MSGPQPFFIRFSVSFVPVYAQLLQPPPTPGDPIFCMHEVFYNRIILKAHWNSNRCYKMNRLICPDQTLDGNLQAQLVLLGFENAVISFLLIFIKKLIGIPFWFSGVLSSSPVIVTSKAIIGKVKTLHLLPLNQP